MQATTLPRMTPEEFLAWERGQTERHIYFHGEVFAMSGGSPRHSNLAARIGMRLGAALAGTSCDLYTADLRIGLDERHYAYADVVVARRPLSLGTGTKDVVTNPKLVVEVLSKTTEAYDRGPKLAGYLALPSLQHLVLVSQREPRVELYTREGDGSYHYRIHQAGAVVKLVALDAVIAVDELYAGVFELPGDEG